MDLFRRRYEDIQAYASFVVSLCNENGLSHWANFNVILDACAAVCAGKVDQGIKLLREGIVGWQQGGARLWVPIFLKLEAEACAKISRNGLALKLIDQAVATCEHTGERWAMAEILRTKASLLLSKGRDCREIESILVRSLKIAQYQQARCWELRTSCDLSRLWQRQGRNAEALRLLQSAHDQFTEGFESEDLRDAQKLLRGLRENLRRKPSEGYEKRVIGTSLSDL
jgi:predicted ATPase